MAICCLACCSPHAHGLAALYRLVKILTPMSDSRLDLHDFDAFFPFCACAVTLTTIQVTLVLWSAC